MVGHSKPRHRKTGTLKSAKRQNRPRAFPCPYDDCSYAAGYKHHLDTHVRTVHLKETPFACPYDDCSYTAGRKSNLDTHVSTVHLKETPFACPYDDCSYAAGQKRDLDRHVSTVHLKETPFACPYDDCSYAAGLKRNLDTHVSTVHLKETPFACPYDDCIYATGHKHVLNTHVSTVHLKETPFACPYDDCSYAAGYKHVLDTHVRTVHLKETPFACPYDDCSYTAGRKSNLDTHVSTVHLKETPFACPHENCSYAAGRKHVLDTHVRTHTGERPYKCHHCNLRFTTSSNRNAHERRMHEKRNNEVIIKKKEERMNRLFIAHKIPFDREQTISYRACGENDTFARLDFVVNNSADYVTIVSCDEMQHKDYEVICEVARMSKVVAAIRASGDVRKILWLRFNPDTVSLNSKNVRRPIVDREKALIETIKRGGDYVNTDREVAIVYLYYDAYETREGTLRADVMNHPDYAATWKLLVADVIV